MIGYFINFGLTSCRLFEVQGETNAKGALKRKEVYLYVLQDYKTVAKRKQFLNGIIELVKNQILPTIHEAGKTYKQSRIFIKAFADSNFSDVFINDPDDENRNNFIMQFYTETSLYFNIVTKRQTEENLKRLFGTITGKTAIVNIGLSSTEVFLTQGGKYETYELSISIRKVNNFLKQKKIGELWDEETIDRIKTYIKEAIDSEIKTLAADRAIILKDELRFMDTNGYPLKYEDGRLEIKIDPYRDHNHENLFSIDYLKHLTEEYQDQVTINYYYGFKVGHIILELLFESLGIETVIPSDEISIHGSLNAYVFNVAISGSTNNDHDEDMIEACNMMTLMGAHVLSPKLNAQGKLPKKDKNSDIRHAAAIRKCDLLFVSNKDSYIGEQTAREIYGAFLLAKPIALWTEPDWNDPKCRDRLGFIPHEDWGTLVPYLEDDEKNNV